MAIKIYTIKSCPFCAKLKKFLNYYKIHYEEYDIETNPTAAQEMVEKSGQYAVPVIDINGTIIVGFDVSLLKRFLGPSSKAIETLGSFFE